MSKETDAKREVQEILNKSQKALLERIQNFRIQIKEVRERELSKALIPVHDHKPGTTVGAGTEDVPYGKINPKGINKNLEAGASVGNNLAMSKGAHVPIDAPSINHNGPTGLNAPRPTALQTLQQQTKDRRISKAELCKDCGHMHLPTEPHYEKKSELVDEKGNLESNSVKTPYKDGAKSPEVKGDKGGIVLPGKKLKKALSAGGGGGAPSTLVNGDALAGKGKKPVKKPVSLTVQPDPEHKSELVAKALPVDHIPGHTETAPGESVGPVKPMTPKIAAIHAQQGKVADLYESRAGKIHDLAGPVRRMERAIPGQYDSNAKSHIAGLRVQVQGKADAAKQQYVKQIQGLGQMMPSVKPAPTADTAFPMANAKAEPPMAKPPSGKNMGTAVPTSTAKDELEKGDFGMDENGKQAHGVPPTAATAKPAYTGAMHAQAKAGLGLQSPKGAGAVPQAGFKPPAIAPVSPAAPQAPTAANKPPSIAPVSMPSKPAASAAPVSKLGAMSPSTMRASGSLGLGASDLLGLASPKAAGVTASAAKPQAPAAPAAKPGIFGKIGGFRKP